MSGLNRISIALIELTGGRNLRKALEHLQRANLTNDILVLCRGEAPDLKQLPGVRVIEDAGKNIPARRLAALKHARTEWVALIEDTTLLSADWFAALPGLLDDQDAGGFWGPVYVGPDLAARYRALGTMEYGQFTRPAMGGATMPGNCMIMRRNAALDVICSEEAGIVEHVLVPRLAAANRPVRFDPRLTCTYAQNDPHGALLTTRFAHGRLYAARRYARKDRMANIMGAVRAILVPLVLAARGARHLAAQSQLARMPAALIWIVLMSVAWGTGELVGHLAGEGQSEESWS